MWRSLPNSAMKATSPCFKRDAKTKRITTRRPGGQPRATEPHRAADRKRSHRDGKPVPGGTCRALHEPTLGFPKRANDSLPGWRAVPSIRHGGDVKPRQGDLNRYRFTTGTTRFRFAEQNSGKTSTILPTHVLSGATMSLHSRATRSLGHRSARRRELQPVLAPRAASICCSSTARTPRSPHESFRSIRSPIGRTTTGTASFPA